ncbi:hypothetical protein [Cytobacillus dafuensis]|uniref:LysM domain-containing protein n=1 Tax=Cytobacillus dafuensis TaxID=1742359 RepID=A0A5B8Z8P3_CYTDA|nr:hypothetical protein [Cytobacillus dafuensis]QED48653.1 hypothetical protein FSZ17_16125 [Cytobacillus dafuensis]
MKRLAAFLISILIIYVIYYDLTQGTLSEPKEPVIEAMAPIDTTIPFFEKKVSPGETVLSIVEKKINGPLPVPINKVVTDFTSLNKGIKPEEIKFGYTYKFPNY